ncbi:NnrU family protein [bacterium AH-315-J23]|nr:NnrU family protein [bacterium AH-315-J23]PHQ67374.1 MAG: NnrU family protein [Robiginitomaculum sp.]
MYFLIIGVIVFFATHLYSSFRSRAPGRDIKVRLGMMKYMGLYSIFSGAGFVLILWGYGLARPSASVYTPPDWGVHVNMAFMLPALILLLAAYGPRGYIKQMVKHPMLLSIMFWSVGHLLANGELNSVILFGSFLVYAIIDRFAVNGRVFPVKKITIIADLYAVIVGTAVYYLFVKHLHELTIGVPVMAGI